MTQFANHKLYWCVGCRKFFFNTDHEHKVTEAASIYRKEVTQ